MTQDVVENLDLVLAQAFPVMEEKIRDSPKSGDAPRRRAASDGLLEFGDDGNGLLQHAANAFWHEKSTGR
jgi:hypothetical protein